MNIKCQYTRFQRIIFVTKNILHHDLADNILRTEYIKTS